MKKYHFGVKQPISPTPGPSPRIELDLLSPGRSWCVERYHFVLIHRKRTISGSTTPTAHISPTLFRPTHEVGLISPCLPKLPLRFLFRKTVDLRAPGCVVESWCIKRYHFGSQAPNKSNSRPPPRIELDLLSPGRSWCVKRYHFGTQAANKSNSRFFPRIELDLLSLGALLVCVKKYHFGTQAANKSNSRAPPRIDGAGRTLFH